MAASRGVWVSAGTLCLALVGCGGGAAFTQGSEDTEAGRTSAGARGGAVGENEIVPRGGRNAGGQSGSPVLVGAAGLEGRGGHPQEVTWERGAPKGGEASSAEIGGAVGSGGALTTSDAGTLGVAESSGGDPSSAGASSGGASSGGAAQGGASNGGMVHGGASSGGATQSGVGQGGMAQGGAAQGGIGQGGAAQGGIGQGGAARGGTMSAGGGSALGGSGAGGAPALPCGVFINELQVGTSDAPADEFVELYNTCNRVVSLAGYRLLYRAAGGSNDVLLVGFAAADQIAARSFVVVGGTSYQGPVLARWGGGSNGILAALAGGVALAIEGSAEVDALGYGNASNAFVEGASALAPTFGTSIGRLPDGADTNDNWHDFAPTQWTPGAANH